MKVLHTSDWHVGRTIRGSSRADEHRAVLAEIASIVEDEQVDLVIVAGDQFDVSSPTAESETIVYTAIQRMAASGAHVIVLGGNHDNGLRWDAVRNVMRDNIHVTGQLSRPENGGVITIPSRDGETEARVAVLPFVSQRAIVRADDLMDLAEHEHTGKYAGRIQAIIKALTKAAFTPDTVNLITGHMTVVSGEQPQTGGGERAAHTVFDYYVSPQVFPATAHYVALGHLHSCHQVPGPAPTHYCGAPLHMDFGESGDRFVMLIEATPGAPAKVQPVKLTAGRPLATLKGTVEQLAEQTDDVPDNAWLRVRVTESPRSGLADEVRAMFPNAVDIRIEPPDQDNLPDPTDRQWSLGDLSTDPAKLFGQFLEERGIDDPKVVAQFDSIIADYTEQPTEQPTEQGE